MRALKLLTFVLLTHPVFAGDSDFDLGNQLYDQGKFEDAKKAYGSVAQSDHPNANVFYNLGNAEFRLGDLAGSMLNYERALALDPAHPEARWNLDFVRRQTGAKIEAKAWADRLFPAWSGNVYAILAAVAGWTALACAAVFIFRRHEQRPFWTAVFIWFGLGVAAYSGVAIWRLEKDRALAVVTEKRADARFAPADNSTLADSLPTGSHVRILSERGAWTYCELPNHTRAWLASNTIQRVMPAA
ncbi:MAG: hypothetical protein QOD99_3042 [Chthoniobacter sp.]|jgi:tetratricopeptide (TPR) repeat protein|nr:hypothetical protein [Chthoniobacter sp.]